MKRAGGLLSLSPRCQLAPFDNQLLLTDGGGGSDFFSLPNIDLSPVQTSTPTPTPTPTPEPVPVEEIYFSLPYVNPNTGQAVITPHYNASTDEWFGPGAGVEVETTNESDSPVQLTGPDSPFAIFADIAQRALGGAGAPARQPQAPTLVPVSTSGGGGINAGALLLVLALIGGAVWWFFFRKKKGASDAS